MKTLLLSLALLWGCLLCAQNSEISGQVLDTSTRLPIPYASITLKQDNKTITGSLTDDSGNFKIKNIASAVYQLEIAFMGYQAYSTALDLTKSANLNLGTIVLKEEATVLNEVQVTAERSSIEQKIDRKVITVGKDLATAGATASEIMNNIPSVQVDQDGKIALRGNENVRILVDGKPSNLPADQLLRQIPSSSIKKIELITNPNAKHNPEGMSGIINIILNKNTKLGFNGNFSSGVTFGKTPKFNSSTSVNYRQGKVNVFATYSNNFANRYTNAYINRDDSGPDQILKVKNADNSNLLKIGADFEINDKNTLSFYTNQNFQNGMSDVDAYIYTNQVLSLTQPSHYRGPSYDGVYNLAYKRLFDREGASLDIEINHSRLDETGSGRFRIDPTDPLVADQAFQDASTDQLYQTIANVDYVLPLNEKSKLEIGTEGRFIRHENTYSSTNPDLDAVDFSYKVDLYSAYFNYQVELGALGLQLGTRVENYEVRATNYNQDVYRDSYFTAYPSAALTYSVDAKNQIQLSYSRRVDRPSVIQIRPSRDFSTPLITQKGNPGLDPQFTNSAEINWIKTHSKGNFSGGFFIRRIQNQISKILYQDPEFPGTDRLIMSYTNHDDNTSYGFELSGTYRVSKKFDIQPSVDYAAIDISGQVSMPNESGNYEFQNRSVTSSALTGRITANYKPHTSWSFFAFGFYKSGVSGLQGHNNPMYKIDMGARYSTLEGKLNISLRCNDIFDWHEVNLDSQYPYQGQARFKWESRNVYLGLNYVFGGGKYKEQERKKRDQNTLQGGGFL